MMKSIFVLITILFVSHANATPVVGDMVRYKMTSVTAGTTQVTEQKIEVTAVDTAAGTYTATTTVFYNGTSMGSSTQNASLEEAIETESTLDHCAEMPADIASIETLTVPAGTFQVCHIHSEQNGMKMDQYLGKVLFGLVKAVTSNEYSSTTFELMEISKH